MKKISLILFLTINFSVALVAKEKPNFLFIFADDQSYETVAALGNEEVITPNIDSLVNAGTSFINTYNMGGWNGAVCIASRTMINTGRVVWRARDLEPNLKQAAKRGEFWAQMLKKQGYETYMTGKWHIKIQPEEVFDHVAHERPGMPVDPYHTEAVKLDWNLPEGFAQDLPGYNRPLKGQPDVWSPWERSFGGFWEGGKHWSEVLGDDAIGFLENAGESDKPFFMYLAFNAPHDPRQSPKRFVDMYPVEDIKIPTSYQPLYPYKDAIGCGPALRDAALAPFPRTEDAVRVHRQEYYAIITHMDEQIGRILDALEKTGKKDNTYIIFSADHGLACGNHGLIGKQSMYEHSMRPPMVIVGPDVPADQKREALVYLQDIMATTLDLAGVDKPKYVEFNSLMPLIQNAKKASEYESIYGCYFPDLQRMIRVGDLKLIVYPHAKRVRLYDLANDPLELNDRAGEPGQWKTIKALFKSLVELEENMGGDLDLTKFFPELA